MFVDTHCHLNSEALYRKYEEVINEAMNNGVKLFIVPGFDLETSKIAIELATKYNNIYAAIGFHPTEIKNYGEIEYKWLEENAVNPKVVAIGEIGYDFHWDTTTKEEQEASFIRQIEIAKKVNKPLIIHSRDAMQITYQTLKEQEANIIGGVMHSFSGSIEMANEFIKLNFYIGLGGPVTFTNAKEPKIVATNIDINYLITETDSPYLTPHPYRGKENGPKYIPLIAEEISFLRDMDIKDFEKIVFLNALRLFKIKESDLNE